MKAQLILSISIIGISHIGFAQKDNHSDLLNVDRQLRQVLSSMDAYHYSGQMRFKEMGGDTFEITYVLIIPGGKVEIIEGGIDEVKTIVEGIFDK